MTENRDLALREPAATALPATSEFQMMLQMANAICKTEFVPKALRGRPEATLATLMYGKELGLGPMQAMSRIHIIEGHPTLAAELMLGLIRRAGHTVTPVYTGRDKVTLRGKRGDTGEELEVTFSMEDARQISTRIDGKPAKLADKDNWRNYPEDMCWARAVSRLGRRLFSDALYGAIYTPEDFGERTEALEQEGTGYITQGDITEAGVVAGLSGFVARPEKPDDLAAWGTLVKKETAAFTRQRFYPDRGWSQLSDDERALVIAQAKEMLAKAVEVTGAPEVIGENWLLTEREATAIFAYLRDGTAPDREDPTEADVIDAEVVEAPVVSTGAVDEAIREQTWQEIVELCAQDLSKGTASDVESKVRKLYRLLSNVGQWKGDGLHDQLHLDLAEHTGIPIMQVHWSDLGVKANQIEFARKVQASARRLLAEMEGDE